MIQCRLRELMEKKARETSTRITYRVINKATGVSPNTLSSLAQPELPKMIGISVIDRLCEYFDCQVGDLLVHVPDDPPTPSE